MNDPQTEKKAVVALFDCDGTLFSAQFGHGLMAYAEANGREATARKYRRSLLLPFILHKMGLISTEAIARKVLSSLAGFFKGWNQAEAQRAFNWMVYDYLLPSKFEDVIARLQDHQAQGHLVLLVSGQFMPTLELLGEHLKADGVIGSQIQFNGEIYTGRIVPPANTGEDKSQRVKDFFAAQNRAVDWSSSFAYADSITDLGLLSLVGHPVAVYPYRDLYQLAQEKGWEIIGAPKD